MEMVNEIRYNDNNKGGWNQTYSEDQINNWVEYNKTDPDKYPLTDWRSELLKKSALRMTHSVDVSGGSKMYVRRLRSVMTKQMHYMPIGLMSVLCFV